MEWIRTQLSDRGLTQHDLAAAIGLTPIQVNKILTGYRALKSNEADKIRRAFGYRLPEDPRPVVAVAGYVGAGARVPLMDAYEKGDGHYHVFLPDGLPEHGIVAVEVTGDSMLPAYDDGDLLFYTKNHDGVTDDSLNRNCVCCDENDDVWVKRLRKGSEPGLYNLLSINPQSDSFHDVRLKWAAPIRLPLPKELVERA